MKWEYNVVKVEKFSEFTETMKLQEELNSYGKEGWELVGFFYPNQIGVGLEPKLDVDSAIFKRLLSDI